jgi:hypothetical protein
MVVVWWYGGMVVWWYGGMWYGGILDPTMTHLHEVIVHTVALPRLEHPPPPLIRHEKMVMNKLYSILDGVPKWR